MTFTLGQGDPNCLGGRWSGRSSLDGESRLSFTDISSTVTRACDPTGDSFEAWARTVFETHPWERVA